MEQTVLWGGNSSVFIRKRNDINTPDSRGSSSAARGRFFPRPGFSAGKSVSAVVFYCCGDARVLDDSKLFWCHLLLMHGARHRWINTGRVSSRRQELICVTARHINQRQSTHDAGKQTRGSNNTANIWWDFDVVVHCLASWLPWYTFCFDDM